MSFSHHKIWSLVTRTTTDVKVVTSTSPGNTSTTPVSSQMHATHTPQVVETLDNANPAAQEPDPLPSIKPTPTTPSPMLTPSSKKSTPTDQSKLDSLSTLTSCHTAPVSMSTPPVDNSEDTPSRLLVGVTNLVLHTGLLLTPGTPTGDWMDTSGSVSTNANSKTKVSLERPHSEQSFGDIYPFIRYFY